MKLTVAVVASLMAWAVPGFAGTITFDDVAPNANLLRAGTDTNNSLAGDGILLTLCGSMNGASCIPLASGTSDAGILSFGGPTTGQSLVVETFPQGGPIGVTLQITFIHPLLTGTSLSFLLWDTENSVTAAVDNGSGGGLSTQVLTSGISSGATITFSNLAAGTSRLLLTDVGSDGFVIDNLAFADPANAPEAGTFGLFGSALLGLGAMIYRRSRAA